MTDDTRLKNRRADPLMTMTIRVGRNGTVVFTCLGLTRFVL